MKNKKGPQLVGVSRRQQQFLDLQEDLESHLAKLMGANLSEYGGDDDVERGVSVADLFNTVLEFRFGTETGNWQNSMMGCRITWLRQVANHASAFGLSNLAGIIRKHIALRKTQTKRAA